MIGALRAVAWAARTAGNIFVWCEAAGCVIRLATGRCAARRVIAARRRPPTRAPPHENMPEKRIFT
jgi:hypothetical protein